MTVLTRKQREALNRVYHRTTVWAKDIIHTTCDSAYGVGDPLTYREFRKRASSGSAGCVMVHWAGMWLGIEPDGHIHS